MLVNNDFHQPRTIFEILADLSVSDLEKVYTPTQTNGATNGVSEASTVPL